MKRNNPLVHVGLLIWRATCDSYVWWLPVSFFKKHKSCTSPIPMKEHILICIYICIYIYICSVQNPMLPHVSGSINRGFGKGSFFRLGVDPTYPMAVDSRGCWMDDKVFFSRSLRVQTAPEMEDAGIKCMLFPWYLKIEQLLCLNIGPWNIQLCCIRVELATFPVHSYHQRLGSQIGHRERRFLPANPR